MDMDPSTMQTTELSLVTRMYLSYTTDREYRRE